MATVWETIGNLHHALAKRGVENNQLLARVRELEAGLAHAEYVAQEIRTIAEHDRSSGVDDGRAGVVPVAERLREIADLVEAEILGGPSPFRAARTWEERTA